MATRSLSLTVAGALLAADASAAGLSDAPPVSAPIQSLSGVGWTVTNVSDGNTMDALVPGDLLTDLQRAGVIGDPLFGLNFLSTDWDRNNFTYTRTFDLAAPTASASEVYLVFDAVKMAADFYLNGQWVGFANDQWLRYSFAVGSLLKPTGNVLTVVFPTSKDERNNLGRFQACSGGWDWAPYTATTTSNGMTTMSKGIIKDVYLLPVAPGGVTITHIVPHVFHNGPYPLTPLTDATAGPWTVRVRLHMRAEGSGATGTATVVGSWDAAHPVTQALTLPAGESVVELNITARLGTVSLWWPNEMGPQTFYTVNVSFSPSGNPSPLSDSRRIGFRTAYLVTADDSNPSALSGVDGSGDLTMRFRINGANPLLRGGNMIPMEEMEGRQSADAYRALVRSAADAHMNFLRMWGGGTWLPDVFFDACDEMGLLLYHDATFAQGGHSPTGSPTEEAEIRHQVRRVSHHPSIMVFDGCNECEGGGLYDSFVSTTIASEDNSRSVWPSCPAQGWSSGVDRLTSFPNGNPLHTFGKKVSHPAITVSTCSGGNVNCTRAANADYEQGYIGKSIPADTAAACCDACAADPTCYAASWYIPDKTCWFKPQSNGTFTGDSNVISVFPPGHVLPPPPPPPHRTIEVHGPYIHGSGFPQVNGGGKLSPINTLIPASLGTPSTAMGTTADGTFTSEFGASVWSSFESTAPTLPPFAWGVQGGAPPDTCTGGFNQKCEGNNLAAQRNYPAASWIVSYFGANATDLNATGEKAFRGQLYMTMLGQAMEVSQQMSIFRSNNWWGISEWQLGEIWPTGGWGSIEYGTVGFTPGQVLGGRWKPLHHFLADHFYLNVMAHCGVGGRCYVRNDNALGPFTGTFSTSLVRLDTGAASPLAKQSVSLAIGANAIGWFCADGAGAPNSTSGACANDYPAILTKAGCAPDGSDCLLMTSVADANNNVVDAFPLLLAAPLSLKLRPVNVAVAFGGVSPDHHAVDLTVTSDAPALFVTLTTLAQGRFSTNAFLVTPQAPVSLQFLGVGGPVDVGLLESTLTLEHVGKYVHV